MCLQSKSATLFSPNIYFRNSILYVGQVGILRCHPDLAGKLAAVGDLTEDSAMEQKAAGLDSLSSDEKATLDQLNSK